MENRPFSLNLSINYNSKFHSNPILFPFPHLQKSAPANDTEAEHTATTLMDDDWDLQAIVRGCSSSSATTSAATSSSVDLPYSLPTTTLQPPQDGGLIRVSDLFERSSVGFVEELHDLYKPFFPRSHHLPLSPPSFSLSGLSRPHHPPAPAPEKQKQAQSKHPLGVSRGTPAASASCSTTQIPTPRSKRRKNQMKKVCQVPGEDLSSDMWSWRKYGQKPIKGSPYPRGYYRCSTSKGCLARKQVERNRSDPAMFIVTYTGEHNHPMPTHRNSLAGSTRPKITTPAGGEEKKPPGGCSPPVSPATSNSPGADKTGSGEEEMLEVEEEREEEEDATGASSDAGVSEDFFEGLEELATAGDCFSGQFPGGLTFTWMTNSATTTAAEGG